MIEKPVSGWLDCLCFLGWTVWASWGADFKDVLHGKEGRGFTLWWSPWHR